MVADRFAVTSETSSFLHSRAEGHTQYLRMLHVCAAASVLQHQSLTLDNHGNFYALELHGAGSSAFRTDRD
jgi:hypothetical protein